MSPKIVALMIQGFLTTTNANRRELHAEFNQAMLLLGPTWWSRNLDIVRDELVLRYDASKAMADVVVNFVQFHNSL